MRSQSETEKHIATNGISPSSRAPADGLFPATGKLMIQQREWCVAVPALGPDASGRRWSKEQAQCATSDAMESRTVRKIKV